VSDLDEKQRIAAAVARITGTLELVEDTDAIELLAGFIDAGGAVRFSQLLEEMAAAPRSAHPTPLPPSLPGKVMTRLAEIEARLDDGFTHAFRPRYRLTTPGRAWSTLGQFGLINTGQRLDSTAFKKACRALWAPYNEFLETQLKRLRFAIRDLRDEVAKTLHQMGPAAAELTQLDAALTVGTRGVIDDLYRRITPAFELLFEARLKGILRRSDGLDVTIFSEGFSQNGWLGEILSDAAVLYHALLGREGRRLVDLVKNALLLHESIRVD